MRRVVGGIIVLACMLAVLTLLGLLNTAMIHLGGTP